MKTYSLENFIRGMGKNFTIIVFFIGVFVTLMGLVPFIAHLEVFIKLLKYYSFVDALEYLVLFLSDFEKIAMPMIIIFFGLFLILFSTNTQTYFFDNK